MIRSFPEYWLYWTYLTPGMLATPLVSPDGRRVAILEYGEMARGEGPDFTDALVDIDGVRYRGDIEFHVDPHDWFRHGHEGDARYRRVVVHMIWSGAETLPADLNERFVHIDLSSHLNLPLENWRAAMLQLEDESAGAGVARRSTQGLPLFNQPRKPVTVEEISKHAEQRMARKITRLQTWCESFSLEDVCFIGLAEVLGYSKNKFPLRHLAWHFPPSVISQLPLPHRSPVAYWTFLSSRGNLLPRLIEGTAAQHDGADAEVRRLYETFYHAGHYPVLNLTDWHFGRVRPANRPIIRLAALAQLMFHYQAPGLFETLLKIAMERLPVETMLMRYAEAVQLRFYPSLLGALAAVNIRCDTLKYVMGERTMRRFIVNALLPILIIWARRTENNGFEDYLRWVYEHFPSTETSQIVHTGAAWHAEPQLLQRMNTLAYYQQGFLEYLAAPAAQL